MRTWSDAALRRLALAMFGLAVALAVVNPVVGRGAQGRPGFVEEGGRLVDYGDSVFCILMATAALLILWYRPRHGVGWVLLAVALVEDLCVFGQSYGVRAVVVPEEHLPLGLWALALSAPLWVPAVFLPVTALLLRYPSGHVEGRWPRRVDRAVIFGLVLIWAGYAGSANAVTDEVTGHLPPVLLPVPLNVVLMVAGAVLLLSGTVFTIVHAVSRLLHAAYPERQQLAWLLTVTPAAVLAMFLPYQGLQRVLYLVPFAVAVGVLRYRLGGIEVVVRRTLLYGTLTLLVLLVFVAVTALLSSALPPGGVPQVVAAALVAVGVVPLRDRLQRGVDRLVYGDRRDPLAALARLGTPLGLSADASVLPGVLSALVASLRVPGAELVGAGGAHVTVGPFGEPAEEVPLLMGGEGVGVLRLARRQGEAALPAVDRRLVDGLAPLVAAVLHAAELAEALRVEQALVVAATETERSRLRQELHDGLGPSLTGIGLGLEALESRVGTSDLVARLRLEAAASLEEVRRIIDGLRPGALEQADLLTLLRVRAENLSATTPVRVTVVAPARLPALRPEVEEAALRVVEEALTNVVRHAGATACTVTVSLDDALRVEVRDDGRGYAGPRAGGVGLGSMRTRAERLGGRCEVSSDGSGTVVTLALPVGVAA